MKRHLSIWLSILALSAFDIALAKTPETTPATAASLNDENTQRILTYVEQSNAVRDKVVALLGQPQSEATAKQLKTLGKEMHDLDEGMRPVLNQLIRHDFWSETTTRNEKIDNAVWLALQHVFDVELVKISLPQMLTLFQKGVFPGRFYALMYDRLAITEGRKQKFGSQTKCIDGRWTLLPLEDAEHVEAYRQEYGFRRSLADEQAQYTKMTCTPAK